MKSSSTAAMYHTIATNDDLNKERPLLLDDNSSPKEGDVVATIVSPTGTTAAAAAAAVVPPPPYTRVLLSKGCSDDNNGVPFTLQPYMTIDDWKEFWHALQPLHANVERHTFYFKCAAWFLFAAAVVAMTWLIGFGLDTYGTDTYMYINLSIWTILYLIIVFLVACMAQVRDQQRTQLRQACRWQQEKLATAAALSNYKLTVECEFEWWTGEPNGAMGTASGFAVYFRPVSSTASTATAVETLNLETKLNADHEGFNDVLVNNENGSNRHLRIQLFAADPNISCTTKKPAVSLPYLQSFDRLPAALCSSASSLAAQDVWTTRFWPTMMRHSQSFLSAYDWHMTLNRVFLALVISHLVILSVGQAYLSPDVQAWLSLFYLIGLWIMVVLLFRSPYRQASLQNQRSDLVQEFAAEFAAHGLCIEFRRHYEFDDNAPWFGCCDGCCNGMPALVAAHYLYVYPMLLSSPSLSSLPVQVQPLAYATYQQGEAGNSTTSGTLMVGGDDAIV